MIQGNQYRPTKIPLTTVRPFEYTEVSQCHFFHICNNFSNYPNLFNADHIKG